MLLYVAMFHHHDGMIITKVLIGFLVSVIGQVSVNCSENGGGRIEKR